MKLISPEYCDLLCHGAPGTYDPRHDKGGFPEGYIPGCTQRESSLGEMFKVTSARERATYPRDTWPEIAKRNRSLGLTVRRIYDQGPLGQCSLSSSVGGWWIKAIQQFGARNLPPNGLSSLVMYQELVRRPSEGIAIDRAMEHFQKLGTLPLDTRANREWMRDRGLNPEHVAPAADWSWTAPRDCGDTRQHFRPDVIIDCADFEDLIISAAENDPAIYGRDQHAICLIDFQAFFKSTGKLTAELDYLNTWGDWGDPLGPNKDKHQQHGRGRDSEQRVSSQVRLYGALRIVSVYTSPLFRSN